MFEIQNNEVVTRKISFLYPGKTGDRQGGFTVNYKVPSQDVINKMQDEEWRASDVIDEVVESVEGITINGKEVQGEEALEAVKNYPPAVFGMHRSFWKTVVGKEAETKNSRKRR